MVNKCNIKNFVPSRFIIVDLLQIDLKAKFVVGAAIPETKTIFKILFASFNLKMIYIYKT
jgi:hypothetical protein